MKFVTAILLAAGILGTASAAHALPAAPAPARPGIVVDVGWRCGPGWHLNPWGHCVPNRRYYRTWGYWEPPRVYHPRHHWRHRHWHHRHWRYR